jgi:hypothetical protein
MKNFSNLTLDERCKGCDKVHMGLCTMYLEPLLLWSKIGGCAGRTHMREKPVENKVFVDPLKASKMKARGKKR